MLDSLLIHFFRYNGRVILVNALLAGPTCGILLGMSLPLFIYGSTVLISRGFRSWSTRITSLAGLTGLLGLALFVVAAAPGIFKEVGFPLVFVENQLDLKAAFEVVDRLVNATSTARTLSVFLLMYLSDAIVIWRASFVCYDHRYIIWSLWVLWALGLVGVFVLDSAFIIKSEQCVSKIRAVYLQRTGQYVSVIINMLTTGLIYYKLWRHRNIARPIHGMTEAQRVLLLLVETGAIFCLLQFLFCLIQDLYCHKVLPNVFTALLVKDILFASRSAFSAVYPTLVIVLVEAGKAVTESYDFGSLIHDRVATPGPAAHEE